MRHRRPSFLHNKAATQAAYFVRRMLLKWCAYVRMLTTLNGIYWLEASRPIPRTNELSAFTLPTRTSTLMSQRGGRWGRRTAREYDGATGQLLQPQHRPTDRRCKARDNCTVPGSFEFCDSSMKARQGQTACRSHPNFALRHSRAGCMEDCVCASQGL